MIQSHCFLRDAVPYNMKSPFGPTVEARFGVLQACWMVQESICCSYTTLMQKILPRKNLFNKIIRLQVGDEISISPFPNGWLTMDSGKTRLLILELSVSGAALLIYILCLVKTRSESSSGEIRSKRSEFNVLLRNLSSQKIGSDFSHEGVLFQ